MIEEQQLRRCYDFNPFIDIKLSDWNGNRVMEGDRICIELPGKEIDVNLEYVDTIVWEPKKVFGELSFRLSEGIGIKVDHIQVIPYYGEDDFNSNVNGWMKLRYTKWKWYKI